MSRHNSEVLLFEGGKRLSNKSGHHRKRKQRGEEEEAPGCSVGIVQSSASEGHLSLAAQFTQVLQLRARFVGLERRLLSAGRRCAGGAGVGVGGLKGGNRTERGDQESKRYSVCFFAVNEGWD